MPGQDFDAVVVGAGILGLATAREWLRRIPHLRLAVLEKEDGIARHQTGRNSGVIHSGVYYLPGSVKAKLCISGADRLITYCRERGIAVQRVGKLIIATREGELPGLDELLRRGTANGVHGLQLVDESRIAEIEPNARGLRALYCPETSIVDYTRIAAGLADGIRAAGGMVQTSTRIERIVRASSLWRLEATGGTITTRWLITCAGLQSDRLAAMTGGSREPRILPFRGDYLVVKPERRTMVRGLIYPVPDRRFPFLGIHATKRIDGQLWLGPNAVLAFAREGYRFGTINLRDLAESVGWSGFWILAARYWQTGLAEMLRDINRGAFVDAVKRFLPSLERADVLRGPSGIRAQALTPNGELVDDFLYSQEENALHVRNAPSPAATSCLAIAELIVNQFHAG